MHTYISYLKPGCGQIRVGGWVPSGLRELGRGPAVSNQRAGHLCPDAQEGRQQMAEHRLCIQPTLLHVQDHDRSVKLPEVGPHALNILTRDTPYTFSLS